MLVSLSVLPIGGDHGGDGGDVSPPTIKLSPPTIIGNKTIFFLNIVIWNKCTTTQGVLIINVKQCVFKFWKIMIPLFLKMVWFTCCFHRAGLPAAPCFSQLAKYTVRQWDCFLLSPTDAVKVFSKLILRSYNRYAQVYISLMMDWHDNVNVCW